MITGEDVPKLCAECEDSYWEEMTCGEMPYCGEYNKLCEEAIKQCDKIPCCKCSCCPRNSDWR